MRILLTNDDGIRAPGIQAAYRSLSRIGSVFMVAPERPRSAAGHAITLHKPLRLSEMDFPDNIHGWAASGTPTDCVTLGLDVVMEGSCDLVVSGINSGANLGWDLTYSGTVAAAFEGAVLNIPSIAISLAFEQDSPSPHNYLPAAEFLARLAQNTTSHGIKPNTFLNVNVPDLPEESWRGAVLTHQGRREYTDRIIKRIDPNGRPYYWQSGNIREDEPDPGSDVHAILMRKVSVTPIGLDMTDYQLREKIHSWDLFTAE